MGAHKVSPKVITLDVADTGRRRRWSDAEKLRIVAEAEARSRLVSATARRHGVSRLQLMKWRRLASAGLLGGAGPLTPAASVGFARVVVSAALDGAAVAPAPPERIEIVLVNGRRLIVSETVGAAALARIIAAAERA